MNLTFFVDIQHLNAFEYDIARTLFLTCYKDRFVFPEEDIVHSQERSSDIIKTSLALWAFDRDDNQYKAIFLFNKPRPNVLRQLQQKGVETIVFHKRCTYSERYDFLKSETFSSEFLEKFEKVLEEIYLQNADGILKEIIGYCGVFLKEYTDIPKNLLDKSVFKYYSPDAIKDAKRKIVDGYVSFVPPSTCNDTEDCDIILTDETNVRDEFRILCTAQTFDDNFMWEEYAANYTGYCYEYNRNKIINAVCNGGARFCLYGCVRYDSRRPSYTKLNSYTNSNSEIRHFVKCLFTKSEKWQNEREFRFVIPKYRTESYHMFETGVERVYKGYSADRSITPNTHPHIESPNYPLEQLKPNQGKNK